jgi:predicted lysophospholipase L1 biosynthesis ABC-type transport system permease subunit
MFSSNISYSVNQYLISQIKPLLGGDIVFSADADIIDQSFKDQYEKDFRIAETIETTTTLFDIQKNPSLVELVYHDSQYPIYDIFSYDVIDIE